MDSHEAAKQTQARRLGKDNVAHQAGDLALIAEYKEALRQACLLIPASAVSAPVLKSFRERGLLGDNDE